MESKEERSKREFEARRAAKLMFIEEDLDQQRAYSKYLRLTWFVRLLRAWAKWAPFGCRMIWGEDGSPYLYRVYSYPRWIGRFLPWRPYIHYFFRGDNDPAHHNHPWEDSWSFILTNGYTEERLDPRTGKLWAGFRYPWRLPIHITKDTYHKVSLMSSLGRDCRVWTLFFAGHRMENADGSDDWGFMGPDLKHIGWRPYVESRGKTTKPEEPEVEVTMYDSDKTDEFDTDELGTEKFTRSVRIL